MFPHLQQLHFHFRLYLLSRLKWPAGFGPRYGSTGGLESRGKLFELGHRRSVSSSDSCTYHNVSREPRCLSCVPTRPTKLSLMCTFSPFPGTIPAAILLHFPLTFQRTAVTLRRLPAPPPLEARARTSTVAHSGITVYNSVIQPFSANGKISTSQAQNPVSPLRCERHCHAWTPSQSSSRS